MKTFIHKIDMKKRLFYSVVNGKLTAFYLSNRLAKIFFPMLQKGFLIDFEVKEETTRKINNQAILVYPVLYFKEIVQPQPKMVLYDLKKLQIEMKKVIKQYDYYLFLDLEMSMPGYSKTPFIPEILQIGYILSNSKGAVIQEHGYYVLPSDLKVINKRTIKFLHLDYDHYMKYARPYEFFYEDLKKLISTYRPQFVVWGKNDVQALDYSYKIHHVNALTKPKMFINLLKLHKDYYNLSNDLGLFDAYKTYYNLEAVYQAHDALTDAKITKEVFYAFLKIMEDELKEK